MPQPRVFEDYQGSSDDDLSLQIREKLGVILPQFDRLMGISSPDKEVVADEMAMDDEMPNAGLNTPPPEAELGAEPAQALSISDMRRRAMREKLFGQRADLGTVSPEEGLV